MGNPYIRNSRDRLLSRLLEMLPGILTWLTLIGCVVFSILKPAWVAVFIICFDIYWLIKAFYLAIYLVYSYRQMKQALKTDWSAKLASVPGSGKLTHLVILPMVSEGMDIITPTLQALKNVRYPKERMLIVLAVEERGGVPALAHAEEAARRYRDHFWDFLVVAHPATIPGEIQGKGSNITYAAKKAQRWIDEHHVPYEDIIVSVLDLDTCVHAEYFNVLSYYFLINPDRHRASYQPVPLYFNNLWDSPALMRVVALGTTFWMMMEQVRPERLCTFSSHSMSFLTLVRIGFWHTHVVSEDSRIFWQCLLHYHGTYQVVPLFMPVYMDTVLAPTYRQSIINQYKQQRRWAYGAENIPYVFMGVWRDRTFPLRKKIYHMFILLEGNHSWATNALMIFMLGWLPLLFGGSHFNDTLLSQNLPVITQVLMTMAMIGMFVSATLSMLLLPPRPKKYGQHRYLFMLLQWIFLPVTSILLSSFPAIDAQTRLLFGKYLGFWVTEKMRK